MKLEINRQVHGLVLLALILALAGIMLPESDISFDIIVNNTNLAPSSSESTGTGERVSGTTYYANASALELFVFSHANASGQNAEIHLTINGTKVLDSSRRPLGAAEQSNGSIAVIIPKFSSYSVDVFNYHHYEWREYPILSGRNGTLSIDQTIINSGGGGVSFNGNPVDLNGSLLSNGTFSNLNDTKVNKSGDTMGTLNVSNVFKANVTNRQLITNQPTRYLNSDGADVTTKVKANDNLFAIKFITNSAVYPTYGLIGFTTVSDVGFPYFLGSKANGFVYDNGTTALYPVKSGNFLFRFSANGWNNNSANGWSGSTGAIDFTIPGDWNTTSTPTNIVISTTDFSGGLQTRMTILANGSVRINSLADSGNSQVCVHSDGSLYRGSPGC